ncbi:MAG: MscL family protein [Candidatus Falkowbacteria bacterium]
MPEEKTPVKQSFAAGLFAFLKEYSVVGMAIGVIIAQSSKTLIDALVKGIFTPLIDLIVPGEKFQNLTLKLGGAVFDIGSIIDALLSFFIVLTILYIIVKKLLKRDDLIKK